MRMQYVPGSLFRPRIIRAWVRGYQNSVHDNIVSTSAINKCRMEPRLPFTLRILACKLLKKFILKSARSQSAIRCAFAWKNGNEIHTAVTHRRDHEYH